MIAQDPTMAQDVSSPVLPSPSSFDPTGATPRAAVKRRRGLAPGQPADATPVQPTGAMPTMPPVTAKPSPSPSPLVNNAASSFAPLAPPATANDATPSIPNGATTPSLAAGTPTPPPALPNPAGIVPTTPIDPANDLRSSTVLPTSSPALDQARTGLSTATSALSSFDRTGAIGDALTRFGIQPTDVQAGGAVSTDPSGRLSKYNGLVDDSASNLAGVDRVALAKNLLQQFDDAQLPEHELALQQLTEKYAAKGGGRSGMLRTAYGNEDLVRQRDRDAMKSKLISDALEGSIQDQFNKTNALSSLQSSTFGQDATTRGEQRADRGYQTDVATGNADRKLNAAAASRNFAGSVADAGASDAATRTAAAKNLFDTLSGEAAGNRAETRGERAYENQQEQDSYGRAVTQQQLEQQQGATALQQALAQLGAGETGNPANILAAIASGSGLDSNLIAQLAASLGQKSTAQPSVTVPGAGLPSPTGIQIPDYGGTFS